MLRSAGLLLLAFILQSTIAHSLSVFSARPDFILLILVYIGLSHGPVAGTLMGWMVGLLQDFYGPAVNLGLNALCKTLVGYLAGYGKERLYKDSLLNVLGLLIVAVILHDLVYYLIDTHYDVTRLGAMVWRYTLLSSVYTALIGAAIALGVAYRRGRFNARRIFSE